MGERAQDRPLWPDARGSTRRRRPRSRRRRVRSCMKVRRRVPTWSLPSATNSQVISGEKDNEDRAFWVAPPSRTRHGRNLIWRSREATLPQLRCWLLRSTSMSTRMKTVFLASLVLGAATFVGVAAAQQPVPPAPPPAAGPHGGPSGGPPGGPLGGPGMGAPPPRPGAARGPAGMIDHGAARRHGAGGSSRRRRRAARRVARRPRAEPRSGETLVAGRARFGTV